MNFCSKGLCSFRILVRDSLVEITSVFLNTIFNLFSSQDKIQLRIQLVFSIAISQTTSVLILFTFGVKRVLEANVFQSPIASEM